VASTEEIARQTVYGNALIADADSMSISALDRVDGQPVQPGEPSEIMGALRSLEVAREGLLAAGREGLAILNGIATAASALGTIGAAGCPTGLRPTDAVIVGTLAEMKINLQLANKVAWCLASGMGIMTAAAPMVGGYAGGPAGTAILGAAYAIFGRLMHRCDLFLILPIDIRLSCTSTRGTIWALSISCQAITRNMPLPVLALPYAAGGPWTESFFLESAATVTAAIASGASFQTPHPARAALTDHVTPLEMASTTRMALAAVGMTRREANRLVNQLLPCYEPGLKSASPGLPYSKCFSLSEGRPSPSYVEFVAKLEGELDQRGLPLKNLTCLGS
jgi:methylamine--corrinoid protein Co-methyltransferase